MELRELRIFVAVAEELSFTGAAARLHLSQQSVSANVARLERRVGTPLLVRTTRSVSLTAAGGALLDDARPLLATADAVLVRARGRAGQLSGHLRLGCSFDLQPLLTPAVRGLQRGHAGLQVDVTVGGQRSLLQELRARRLDALLTWRRPVGDGDLEVQRLLDAPLLAVVRADDQLAQLVRMPRATAAARPVVVHRRGQAPGPYDEMVEQLYEGRPPGPLHPVDVLTSGHEARAAVLRSADGVDNVALMADFAYGHLDSTGLVARELDPPMTVSVDLLWLPDASDSVLAATGLLATALLAADLRAGDAR